MILQSEVSQYSCLQMIFPCQSLRESHSDVDVLRDIDGATLKLLVIRKVYVLDQSYTGCLAQAARHIKASIQRQEAE